MITNIIKATTLLSQALEKLPIKEILSSLSVGFRIANIGGGGSGDSGKTTDLSTGLTEGGNGKSNKTSTTSKDFSRFELNILDQRIALQKLSGGLLNEDVVTKKRGIIFAKAAVDTCIRQFRVACRSSSCNQKTKIIRA